MDRDSSKSDRVTIITRQPSKGERSCGSIYNITLQNMEPLNKGHIGTSHFTDYREVVLSLELEVLLLLFVLEETVLFFSVSPLSEVPLKRPHLSH